MKTAELFLAAMQERHGVSRDFVEAARPLVDSIYAEFDGEQREGLLEFAESVFAQQGATESAVRSSTRDLDEATSVLKSSLTDFFRAFGDLNRSVAKIPAIPAPPPVPRWLH